MKKRFISVFLVLVLLAGLLPMGVMAAEKPRNFIRSVAQWEKLPEDYIGIYTEDDLRCVEYDREGKYILMDNIRLSSDWDSIGSENEPFKGVFDGNGYTISGLKQYAALQDGARYYGGLFARLYNAEVKNIRVEGSIEVYVEDEVHTSRSGRVYLGGIAGYSEDSTITNCFSDVDIRDNQDAASAIGRYFGYGGIAGHQSGGKISYCRNKGTFNSYNATGGIVGETADHAEIYACLNEGEINGNLDAGGIIGDMGGDSTVRSCANEGKVLCADGTGGIAGASDEGSLIADCINIGVVDIDATSGGFCFGGGITRGRADVERCINMGWTRYGAIRSGSYVDYPMTDCYFLEGCGVRAAFSPSDGLEPDTEGMLTAEQLKDPDSFNNFVFPLIWTLEEGMDNPYPTALLDTEMENPFKIAYVQELLRDAEKGERRMSIFEGSGVGSAAAILSETYRDAGLHIVNKGWDGISCINDCMSFDFDVENDFDVLLADLLMAYSGMEGLGDLMGTELFGEYSDMVTHLCNAVEGISNLEEIQTSLTEAGKAGGELSDEAQQLMDATNDALSGKISMGDVNKAFTLLGCVTDTIGTGIESAQDLIDFFSLVNAYDGAGSAFGEMLGDISAASYSVESNTGRAMLLRSAIGNLKSDMESMIAGDPLAFYEKMGEEIVDLGQTGANCVVNICSGFSDIMPVAAGIRMGFGMGVFFGDQVTNMDAISYYGNLMDLSGYLAECCFEVAMDYKDDFMAEPDYESALRLNTITELYLRIQSLSCQYAYNYSMALAEKSIFKSEEHIKAAAEIDKYRAEVDTLLDEGKGVMINRDGGISGFVASCPVTVVVEDEDGVEIARLESGRETRSPGYADYYCVFGENMDKKTGLYGAGQTIRIIAEAEGSMDLVLFDSKDGVVSNARIFGNVTLEAGDEFVPEGLELVKNGEESLKASCLGEHSWDEGRIETEAGCESEGKKRFSCLVCGRGGSLTLAPLGHEWIESETLKEPSETEEGEALFTCSRCGETKIDVLPKIEIPFKPFDDVPESAYYYTPVEWAVKKGITTGVGGGLFAPNQGCTRAQVVTFLWRAAGKPAPESDYNPFTDVEESKFYYEAVLWAVEQGITGGVSSTSFAPDATCTRGQIVTFLYRAFGEPETEMSENPFRDVADSAYYLSPVLWAVEKGVTTGMSADSFAPGATCTRAQVVTFLYRAYN